MQFNPTQSNAVQIVLLIVTFSWITVTSAQTAQSPYTIVLETTDQIIKQIERARPRYEQYPDEFHQQIDLILSGITDFYSFSRSVMGVYASKSAMAGLNPEQQARLNSQVQRFSQRFKQGLIETYAKGLMKFSGEKIEVNKPRETLQRPSNIITQYIFGDRAEPYRVQYKFRKNRLGEWKLRNLTIENINLGKIFREQFASEYKRFNGDIDAVIDNWAVSSAQSRIDGASSDGET